MRIDDIAITPRKRDPWQAINLGIAMAREWYWPAFLSWMVPAAIVTTVVAVAFPFLAEWLPILVFWWFKPLWDRGPMHIASRRLFGEQTGFLQTMKALPKLYWRDAFWALTWRRFSLARSYDMPVTLLENLSGAQRRARIDVLQREGAGPAFSLLMVLLHIEMFLVYAVGMFAFMLVPEKYFSDFISIFSQDMELIGLIHNVLYFFAASLIGPFYSICGFSQYINRRVNLEGWDIELHFRGLVSRVEEKSKSLSSSIAASVLLCAAFLFAPAQEAVAQAQSVRQEDNAAVFDEAPEEPEYSDFEEQEQLYMQSQAEAILAGEAFHQMIEDKGLRFKDVEKAKEDKMPGWLIRFLEWLENRESSDNKSSSGFEGFIRVLATILEVAIWVAVAFVVYWVVRKIAPHIQKHLNHSSESDVELPPDEMFGLDLRAESIPKKPDEEVLKLWDAGAHREALSLLYRATLSELINRHQMAFKSHFTERECYQTVKRAGLPTLSDYFLGLTNAWQSLAYAHRNPSEDTIRDLCFRWREAVIHEE